MSDILTKEEMQQFYGDFYRRGAGLRLNRTKFPERLWPLLPYAEFWGLVEDVERDELAEDAPAAVQANLMAVVTAYDDVLDEWLAGPEEDKPGPSDEYVAFTIMRMASDFL